MHSTAQSSKRSAVRWIESLSPWPADGFGLERIRALLAELGEPQRRYRSIHVVGSNGKSTVTRTAAAILHREGLRVGAYTSPHVSGWSERIQVDGDDADFEAAVERVRGPAERLGATQFEILTAAALAEFAEAGVEVAVVEAGLGGRLDATNVLDAAVVVLTNARRARRSRARSWPSSSRAPWWSSAIRTGRRPPGPPAPPRSS